MRGRAARRGSPVVWVFGLVAALLTGDAGAVAGQRGRGGAPPGPPPTAREAAHFDLTGYWTAVITEDWRYRMVTPPRGDVRGVPLSAEGRKVAEAWDPAADAAQGQACRAYGAGGIMRMPTRLRIAWEDDWTLRIDTDAGQQTRLLRFRPEAAPGRLTWQGQSAATWEKQQLARGFGRLPAEGPGTLRVVTTNALPGYLRRNGVPYSDRAVITETFVRHADFGDEWFTVITTVEDPVYLARSFITSTHFKREADGSGWRPAPCAVVPPLQ